MLSGVILAGGVSERMAGERKALLPFHGRPLIAGQLARMRPLCDELIVVTDDPQPLLPVLERGVRLITDFYPQAGALGGMHAGLSLARHEAVWIVGGDMPFVSSQAAELLLAHQQVGLDAAIPLVQGGLYPLHGIYARRCRDQAVELLEAGEKRAAALLRHLFWSELGDASFRERGVPLNFVASVKTPDDYARLVREAEAEAGRAAAQAKLADGVDGAGAYGANSHSAAAESGPAGGGGL